MQVIPAINATDFEVVKKQARIAAGLSDWVHIDVADGTFTNNITWAEPEKLPELRKANYEIHLMVAHPEKVAEVWLKNGAKRLVVHLETLVEPETILKLANSYGAQVMLSIAPQTPVDNLLPHLEHFQYFQILAVPPGLAGQRFGWENIQKITFLRQKAPTAIIEVDGGINLETAKLCKNAGANIVVSASYIFGSLDHKKAYEELQNSA